MGITVRPDDLMNISIRSILAGQRIRGSFNFVHARGKKPEMLSIEVTDADGDRSVTQARKRINSPGVIEAATVAVVAGQEPTQPSELAVSLAVVRDEQYVVQIVQGAFYTDHVPSWPGARLESHLDGPGRKVDNEATTTLANNTAATRTVTVPTLVNAELHGGHLVNADDVTRVLSVHVDDGAQVLVRCIQEESTPTLIDAVYPPNLPDDNPERILAGGAYPFPLSPGDRVQFTWAAGGVSAGGTARSSAVWKEWIVAV